MIVFLQKEWLKILKENNNSINGKKIKNISNCKWRIKSMWRNTVSRLELKIHHFV